LKISKPVAAVFTPSNMVSATFDKATLGINTPLSVELISKTEDASGFVVPIPTCAYNLIKQKVQEKTNNNICFINELT
jgi:hypothetical protein